MRRDPIVSPSTVAATLIGLALVNRATPFSQAMGLLVMACALMLHMAKPSQHSAPQP